MTSFQRSRFKPVDKYQLKSAIDLFVMNKNKCLSIYGESNSWDISNVRNMNGLFLTSKFDGDISEWDVSRKVFLKE